MQRGITSGRTDGSDDPLVLQETALCSPHSGYVTRESYELYFGQAFAQINEFAAD